MRWTGISLRHGATPLLYTHAIAFLFLLLPSRVSILPSALIHCCSLGALATVARLIRLLGGPMRLLQWIGAEGCIFLFLFVEYVRKVRHLIPWVPRQ
jgi:hypothetical protein